MGLKWNLIFHHFHQVKQIFNKSVSWVRVRDHHILTVDRTTFIADERFHAYYSSTGQLPGLWTLQIKYVQARDAGMYECHLNFYGDEQKTSARVQLNVVGKFSRYDFPINRFE